jgi:hypothetical protein
VLNRLLIPAFLSWVGSAVTATLTGLVSAMAYLCFYEHQSSGLLYNVKSFFILVIFGLCTAAPIFLIITLLISLPLLLLIWTPAWLLRKKSPLFGSPVFSALFGLVIGFIYWKTVVSFHHSPDPHPELAFGSYVGASLGGCFMFIFGSFWRTQERKRLK